MGAVGSRPAFALPNLLQRREPLTSNRPAKAKDGDSGARVQKDVDPTIPLDVDLVQQSWREAVPSTDDDTFVAVGTLFLERIFTMAPEALPLWGFDPDPEIRKETHAYARHAIRVVRAVDGAIQKLDDLDNLGPVLERLGKRHNNYGVEEAHYPIVGGALLWTLEAALGPKGRWNDSVEAQWLKVWDFVSTKMKVGQGFIDETDTV